MKNILFLICLKDSNGVRAQFAQHSTSMASMAIMLENQSFRVLSIVDCEGEPIGSMPPLPAGEKAAPFKVSLEELQIGTKRSPRQTSDLDRYSSGLAPGI